MIYTDNSKVIATLQEENEALKKDYEETEALLDKQIEATFKLDRENKALKKRLKKIELLCYRDGSDGEILAEIMKYFSKADE